MNFFGLKKIALFISGLAIFYCVDLLAQQNDSALTQWTSGTAYTMQTGRWEVGLFQPLRYGINESVELSAHPILFFVMPNLRAKWQHYSDEFIIASQHTFYYPTPLLRIVSKESVGGLISPEFIIPHMFAVNNGILITREVLDRHFLTAKASFTFAVKFGGLDERTTIDLPFIYSRLAVFYNNYDLRFGLDWYGHIDGGWWYRLDADFFVFPGAEQNFAFEQMGLVYWRKSDRLEFSLGYKLIYGEYPFGTQWHLVMPVFDVQFAWD